MEQGKKAKPALHQAARMVYDAIETAYHYERDKAYIPTPEELEWFLKLEHSLHECHNTAMYISQCMERRARGEKGSTQTSP